MAHANARLTPAGRLTLVGRIAAQPRRPIAHIAHEMGVSRTTAYRWWSRYQQLGQAGLVDRPSIPLRSPRRTAAHLEQRIVGLRQRERLGPARIAARPGLSASTVHRVLVRHQLNRLAWLDHPTGRPIRRSNAARDRALQPWVHRYNHHRAHTALGGRPPISRINNLPGYYI